jgi:hypothetical protein
MAFRERQNSNVHLREQSRGERAKLACPARRTLNDLAPRKTLGLTDDVEAD